MNLIDFVKVYNTPDTDALYQHLQNTMHHRGEWTDNAGNITGYQNLSTADMSMEYRDQVNQWAIDTSNKYCQDFNITLTQCSPIRVNRYDTGDHMDEHPDHIYSLFDGTVKGIPVISMVGFVNDDYKGGEFVFNLGDREEKFKLKAGEVLVFPSAFPWRHRVDPVTQGTRFTWVSWAW